MILGSFVAVLNGVCSLDTGCSCYCYFLLGDLMLSWDCLGGKSAS